MHSIRFFWVKPIGRLFYVVQKKLGNHTISYQCLLLSTTVLNDNVIIVISTHAKYSLVPAAALH